MDDFERELLEAQEQRSQGWRDARAGRFTASEIWKLTVKPKDKAEAKKNGGWGKTAYEYIKKKVVEDITGYVHQESNAYPLVHGEQTEPVAKTVISEIAGKKIKEAGFVTFTDHAGATPDGFFEGEGIEIKCPYNPITHLDYWSLKSSEELKKFKREYWGQMQFGMICCKLNVWNFYSYDGRYPEGMQVKHIRIEPDVEYQQELIKLLDRAIEKKLELLNLLK